MMKYTYDIFKCDIRALKKKIDDDNFKPDAVVAIARGGLTMAHFLSIAYDIRDMYVINAVSYTNKVQGDIKLFNIPNLGNLDNILVVDEIVDSGKSLKKVMKVLHEINPDKKFKTASIFCKTDVTEIMPDYHIKEAKGWIEFFWETDCLDES